MSEQISWHVELQVRPGRMDAFRALTAEMVERTKSEEGTLVYERFIGDDGSVHIFERYVDAAAAVTHMRAFVSAYGARLASLIDRKRFIVLGTPTPELKQILDGFGAAYFAPLASFSRY